MSLRTRLVMLTSAAVAVAIVSASVAAWFLIRSSLMDEVDQRLLERAADVDRIAAAAVDLPGDAESGRFLGLLQGDPIGVQIIDADGEIVRQITPGSPGVAVALREPSALADGGGEGAHVRTLVVGSESYRVVTATASEDGSVLRLFQSLSGVETTLARIAWLLAGVAAVGVAAAGGLGWMTVRAGLRPIGGLVDAAERVAATQDLGHRIEVVGNDRDEVNRLATSVNAMLAALDGARTQQRELIENAGHELRTPLTVLRNDLGLLLRAEDPGRGLAPDERTRVLAELNTEVESLSDLVAEVLDLARGDIEPEPPTETELAPLVERAAARARRLDPQVRVQVEAEQGTAVVRPASLERAITNMVRNAVQVSGPHDEVEVVAAFDRDGELRLTVADRGPGIDPVDLPHLFERFYRGAGARSRHGSGLGLAIVAQVAATHGGTASAANRAGGGAIFTLQVPVSNASGTTSSGHLQPPSQDS